MLYKQKHNINPSKPRVYKIRLQGHLSQRRTEWFGGLTISLEENGDTLLTGPVPDQAALFGLLRKVRDSGMVLIALNPIRPDSAGSSDTPHPSLNL